VNILNLHYLINRKIALQLPQQTDAWDIFISAYNDSERVLKVFDQINAIKKYWIVLPEYNYPSDQLSGAQNVITFLPGSSEAEVVLAFAEAIGVETLCKSKLCIDITGLMRPHILYLVRYLFDHGVKSFDMIYTEPAHYARKENTTFSNEEIESVRQVIGFEGIHDDEMGNDILIMGVGYDHALISRVVNDKDSAKLIQLLSLPSLSADMYQESILRLDKTDSTFDPNMDDRIFFAPANNPFVVASELSDKYKEIRSRGVITNTYLCPLATKPQALGFALFYLNELIGTPSSILFPFSRFYEKETSKGVGRTWQYEINI
jgi:hypothetical protein